ncbi:hypothetical protein D3C73_1198150 [compost metagenome]
MAVGVDQPGHQQPIGQAPDLGFGIPREQLSCRADVGNHAVANQYGAILNDGVKGVHGKHHVSPQEFTDHHV